MNKQNNLNDKQKQQRKRAFRYWIFWTQILKCCTILKEVDYSKTKIFGT